ncbi:MAG: hypothetical protein AB1593_07650 [Pseudomonadota bacterium]
MQTSLSHTDVTRYAKCIEASKRIRWDIDRDVIRDRDFDYTKPFLPEGLSHANQLDFLGTDEKRLFSQVQGRSYANIFGLVERFIGAKVLDVSRDHWLGDQTALEALVRFSDEELKHQEMFRRLDRMMERGMAPGYTFVAEPNAVAVAVLGKSTWAVLGLTCHIELFTQLHYRSSIEPETHIDPLWKDVFLYHWREESQHAILDELEWKREDARLSEAERDRAVDDLIALVGAVDGILQAQAKSDSHYFIGLCRRPFSAAQVKSIQDTVLKAYRWQYILSGVNDVRFASIIGSMVNEAQARRIAEALEPLVN